MFKRISESEQALENALVELEAHWISNSIDPCTGLEQLAPVPRAYVRSTHLMRLGTKYGYMDAERVTSLIIPLIRESASRQKVNL